MWFQREASGGSRRKFQGKVSGGGFRRRFLGSIQWEFLGETLSGGFKRFQGIVSGEDFSESLQVEFLGDGFMRRF